MNLGFIWKWLFITMLSPTMKLVAVANISSDQLRSWNWAWQKIKVFHCPNHHSRKKFSFPLSRQIAKSIKLTIQCINKKSTIWFPSHIQLDHLRIMSKTIRRLLFCVNDVVIDVTVGHLMWKQHNSFCRFGW